MCVPCVEQQLIQLENHFEGLSPFPSCLGQGKIRFYNHLAIRSIGTHTVHWVPGEKLSLRLPIDRKFDRTFLFVASFIIFKRKKLLIVCVCGPINRLFFVKWHFVCFRVETLGHTRSTPDNSAALISFENRRSCQPVFVV